VFYQHAYLENNYLLSEDALILFLQIEDVKRFLMMSLFVMNLNVFARRLRELRLSRHMTLKNMGDAVESKPNTIGNLENAQKSPSLNMVLALADFFGVSVDYLVGRSDSLEPFAVSSYDQKEDQQENEYEDALKKTLAEDKESVDSYRNLCRVIETLPKDSVEKAMSYVAFLRYTERKKERQTRRDSRTSPAEK
jgi:transcriptional regulator with XRE-family HTH domain